MRFRAKLERPRGTGTWTYLVVPVGVAKTFGTRGRVAVRGTIDREPFRSSLMPRGDARHFIVVNKALRERIGKVAGASVSVELTRHQAADSKPATELAAALDESPAAKAAFDSFSHSHRQEYAQWVESAKQVATRERSAEKAVTMIAAGKRLR